jgi:hypothetical protein
VNTKRIQVVRDYVDAYNRGDIAAMLRDFDEAVVFRNISNGESVLTTHGIAELENQAISASKLFREREQRIKSISYFEHRIEVDIDYRAILAVDLPNGMKAGTTIRLKGRSIFTFVGDRIVELEDVS